MKKPPEYIITEPASVYHDRRRDCLSSHALADFVRCPRHYRNKQLGLVADRDSAAYAFGRAAHVLILEGRERYEAEFVVGGPINEKTGKPYGPTTKAFKEFAENTNKEVISELDDLTLLHMQASVRSHKDAASLLASGAPECVVRREWLGKPCQIRIDWFTVDDVGGLWVVDLKTCRNLDDFEDDARHYGYMNQLAFYRGLLASAAGIEASVRIIAVEKQSPYRCGVYELPCDDLDSAEHDIYGSIERLKECEEKDHWPTGYEEVRILTTKG